MNVYMQYCICVFLCKVLPVESIAHLNGDQHRQGHGHGRTSLKDFAVDADKVFVVIVALHEVGLHREEAGSFSA